MGHYITHENKHNHLQLRWASSIPDIHQFLDMMQSQKSSATIAEEPVNTYRSGRLWTQQLEPMPNDKVSRSGSNPGREPFTTIEPNITVDAVVDLLLKGNPALIVLEQKKIIGIITKIDVLSPLKFTNN